MKKQIRAHPNRELGLAIREHRTQLGMGLREFAKAADVDYTLVLRLEQGRDVRLSAFLKLARAHGFPFKL